MRLANGAAVAFYLFQVTRLEISAFTPDFSRLIPSKSKLVKATSSSPSTRYASLLDPSQPGVDDTLRIAAKGKIRRKYKTFCWTNENRVHNINYRVEGPTDGPPVLLIHGFGANISHFRHQFPALVKEGYRVYAVDLLGFGASEKPVDVDYTIDLFVKLLKDFVTVMNSEEKWIVAGNSIGGLCSMALGGELPHLFRGIVLFNTSAGMTGFRYEDMPILLRPIMYVVQNFVLSKHLGGHVFTNFKTRENVESILRTHGVYQNQTNVDEELMEILLRPADDEGAEQVFLKTIAGPAGPTPEDLLPKLTCPVLALWGGADPWTLADGGMHPATGFHRYTDDFELVVLHNVGHCPHDEVPDQVHEHLLPWMKTLDNRAEPAGIGQMLP